MTKVNVIDGDITQIASDALITAINSIGMWFGGVDQAIMSVAGDTFHRQAQKLLPLHDRQVIFASAVPDAGNSGRFTNVIFVVDDLRRPLRDLVSGALNEAKVQGLKSISIPAMRTGVMLGAVEKTKEQALDEMAHAIKQFVRFNPGVLETISIVVYRDSGSQNHLHRSIMTE